MENAEEILQVLDEFSKVKPKDIPRELEEYLCFVAKTGDPIYQWSLIKCLFREKLINVITEFYETCPSVEIPPCPNVDAFNYDTMKNFILEKLDTFAAAPFTVQRICELLTTPRKEYNRIDKYMRALEKNILVVSTREPGNRRNTENGESVVNGLESEHLMNSDINVEVEMDENSVYTVQDPPNIEESQSNKVQDTLITESKENEIPTCSSTIESVITSRPINYMSYPPNTSETIPESTEQSIPESSAVSNDNITVTITNVTEPLAEEPQPESEPPIFVSTVNHKDNTSIYLGTNENGDQVYRIKYEPYVEIDYMALQDTAFPQETVYENSEIKPESSTVQTETKPELATAESEIQPSSTEKPNWEVTNSTDTTISSSDEVKTLPLVTVDALKSTTTTAEDQVTESNIVSESSITQTEEVKIEESQKELEVEETREAQDLPETQDMQETPEIKEIDTVQDVQITQEEKIVPDEPVAEDKQITQDEQIVQDGEKAEDKQNAPELESVKIVANVEEKLEIVEKIDEIISITPETPIIEDNIPNIEIPSEPMEIDEPAVTESQEVVSQTASTEESNVDTNNFTD